jgi:hypothetical protein
MCVFVCARLRVSYQGEEAREHVDRFIAHCGDSRRDARDHPQNHSTEQRQSDLNDHKVLDTTQCHGHDFRDQVTRTKDGEVQSPRVSHGIRDAVFDDCLAVKVQHTDDKTSTENRTGQNDCRAFKPRQRSWKEKHTTFTNQVERKLAPGYRNQPGDASPLLAGFHPRARHPQQRQCDGHSNPDEGNTPRRLLDEHGHPYVTD